MPQPTSPGKFFYAPVVQFREAPSHGVEFSRPVAPLAPSAGIDVDVILRRERSGSKGMNFLRSIRFLWYASRLHSADWTVRARMAEKLGACQERRAVPALIKLLGGGVAGHWEAKLLSAINNRREVGTLADSTGGMDRFPVREQAARALGLIGDRSAVPYLIAALEDPEFRVGVEAARALGRLGDDRAVDPLATLLNSSDTELRETAVIALAQLGAASVKRLVAILSHSSFSAAQAAARALAGIGDPQAIGPLLAGLRHADSAVRAEVIEALAQTGQAAVAPLLATLQQETPQVRQGAIRALAKIKDVRAIPGLEPLVDDSAAEVSEAAWKALAYLEWPPALTREQVLRALAFGDVAKAMSAGAAAIEPIIQFYAGAEKTLRERLMNALVDLARQNPGPLIKALGRPELSVRELAVKVLTQCNWNPVDAEQRARWWIASRRYDSVVAQGASAIKPLVEELDHADENTREMAVIALGRLNEPGSVDSWLRMIDDPAFKVRAAAAVALGQFSEEKVASALRRAAADSHYNVRAAANRSLAKLGSRADEL
jgi:HEAT repeat protein